MERNNFLTVKDSENFSSGYYTSSNQNKDSETNQAQSELNLRNKLNNAFTDLESLRKALKDIRKNNDNIISNNQNKRKNNDKDKYDFFSDERYTNVLSQIKKSNQDKSKSKIGSTSKERSAANSSFGFFKTNKDNKDNNNDRSKN